MYSFLRFGGKAPAERATHPDTGSHVSCPAPWTNARRRGTGSAEESASFSASTAEASPLLRTLQSFAGAKPRPPRAQNSMPRSQNLSSVFKHIADEACIGAIGAYRRVLSLEQGIVGSAIKPILPSGFSFGCRFFPSCSAYAQDAVRQYGLLRGAGVSLMRLARCHPWNKGGYDPLPKLPVLGSTAQTGHRPKISCYKKEISVAEQ